MYESFLSTVSILSSLQGYERAKIADALESRTYQPGESIVTEGEPGDEFFLIESGTAEVKKGDAVVGVLGKGDYFGGECVVCEGEKFGYGTMNRLNFLLQLLLFLTP
jgi:cAMP-dependent protein kinase regulator